MTSPLWVLTFPRSGSSHLTSMLNSLTTQKNQIFNPPLREWYGRACLEKLGKPKTPPVNCQLQGRIDTLTPELLELTHPSIRYLIFVQQDLIGQAVSNYIARYTEIKTHNAEEIKKFRLTPIPLDLQELKRQYRRMLRKTATFWIRWLGDRPYVLITPRQLRESTAEVTQTILEQIGYTAEVDHIPVVKFTRLEHPCGPQFQEILWKMIHAGKLPAPPDYQNSCNFSNPTSP